MNHDDQHSRIDTILNRLLARTSETLQSLAEITVGGSVRVGGTGTINSGSTSATITHGAGITPVIGQIFVTFSENPTNDPGNIWISAITSTQFTVNCRNDPGASNLDFGWSVFKV